MHLVCFLLGGGGRGKAWRGVGGERRRGVLTYEVKTLFALADPGEDFLHFFEAAEVAENPFDFGVGPGFFLDLVDGVLALLFFAIDHDDAGFVEDEGAGDLEALGEMVGKLRAGQFVVENL